MAELLLALIATSSFYGVQSVPVNAQTTTRIDISADQSVSKTVKLLVTAYSSTPDETDDTPFTTASGSEVHDGVVAANALPFGTKIKIPALFGDKVFVVEDRMNKRYKNAVDIWMPSKSAALRFGTNITEVLVLAEK